MGIDLTRMECKGGSGGSGGSGGASYRFNQNGM